MTATVIELVDVAHPCPGAKPGEVIARGPRHRWLAYQVHDEVAAAVYLDGRLLRRDIGGWWSAGPHGQREPVAKLDVAQLLGLVPSGWPVIDEQAPLLGVEALTGEVAS